MEKNSDQKKREWRRWLERPYGPFIVSLVFKGVDSKYFSKIGLTGFGFPANLYQYPDFFFSETFSRSNERVLETYLKRHSIFDLSRLISKVHAKNKREIKKILKSRETAVQKLAKVQSLLCLYVPFLWIVEPMERYYRKKTDAIVPRFVSGDVQQWVGDASVPKKKNAYAKMLAALKKKPLKKVLQEFFWLKSRDGFSEFYTLEELREIKSKIKDSPAQKMDVPVPLKKIVEELREFTFFRAERTDCFYDAFALCRPIFQGVAREIGVSFQELALFDAESILRKKPEKIGIPFNYLYENGKDFFSSTPWIREKEEKTQLVHGLPAFPGLVQGKVCIIKHPSEVDKVKQGNVLVTQMTFPSFISAMKRAAAIVTDEGGIVSHAAILARELKKPCVIGTRNAMAVFKDGDWVKVDADNGIVKRIEKPKP